MKQFGIICHKYLITEKNLNRKYKFPKKNRISTEVISQQNKNNFDYMYSVFYKKNK